MLYGADEGRLVTEDLVLETHLYLLSMDREVPTFGDAVNCILCSRLKDALNGLFGVDSDKIVDRDFHDDRTLRNRVLLTVKAEFEVGKLVLRYDFGHED